MESVLLGWGIRRGLPSQERQCLRLSRHYTLSFSLKPTAGCLRVEPVSVKATKRPSFLIPLEEPDKGDRAFKQSFCSPVRSLVKVRKALGSLSQKQFSERNEEGWE